MNDSFEDRLQVIAKKTFDQNLNNIDDDILNKLRLARKKAVASVQKDSSATLVFPHWLASVSSATAFASVALIATTLVLQPELLPTISPSPFDDISLLSSKENLDFYENIDFYIWLEAQDNAT